MTLEILTPEKKLYSGDVYGVQLPGIDGSFEILTPEKKLYSGDVYGVQLPGIDGSFEILDRHAPIVSALKQGTLKVLKDKNSFDYFTIQGGFVEMLNNKATVLVEGARPVDL